jgi:hypothetical protein
MKRIFLPLLVGGLISFAANAGQFTGVGIASTPPEFVNVNINIISECYQTPTEANTANILAVQEMQKILNSHINKNSQHDKILTGAQETSRHSASSYPYNGDHEYECSGTFKTITKVRLTLDVSKFSCAFANIQEQALPLFNKGADKKKELTYVSINAPWVDVCSQTKIDLKNRAMELAIENAKNKFAICAKQLGIDLSKAQLMDVNDTNHSGYYSKSSAMAYRENSEIEINFDDVTETAEVMVKYSYPNTYYKCN